MARSIGVSVSKHRAAILDIYSEAFELNIGKGLNKRGTLNGTVLTLLTVFLVITYGFLLFKQMVDRSETNVQVSPVYDKYD